MSDVLACPPSQRDRVAALSDTWRVLAIHEITGRVLFDGEIRAIGIHEALVLAEAHITQSRGSTPPIRFLKAEMMTPAPARPLPRQ